MSAISVNGDAILDAGLTTLETRIVVLSRIRGGLARTVSRDEADELLELLRSTPMRPDSPRSLLGHTEGVLNHWYETIGVFLPRRERVFGASRVPVDRVLMLGWLGDVQAMLIAADGPACVGGSGCAVMEAIDARYTLDWMRNSRSSNPHITDDDVRAAERRARNLPRRLTARIGLAWLTCLPKMQAL